MVRSLSVLSTVPQLSTCMLTSCIRGVQHAKVIGLANRAVVCSRRPKVTSTYTRLFHVSVCHHLMEAILWGACTDARMIRLSNSHSLHAAIEFLGMMHSWSHPPGRHVPPQQSVYRQWSTKATVISQPLSMLQTCITPAPKVSLDCSTRCNTVNSCNHRNAWPVCSYWLCFFPGMWGS